MITRLYILFLGLLMALFIGVGIAAFYKGPTPPQYPTAIERSMAEPNHTLTTEQEKLEREYTEEQKIFTEASKLYQRNVSLLALGGAVLLVLLGLTVLKGLPIISDSLLLGGVFTLVYSIIRGFGTDDDGFRFILVAASLAIAITLGYVKLIKPMQTAAKKK